MPITTREHMERAMLEATDGTITLDGILQALRPWEMHTSMLNELIRMVPSQAVLLLLATFVGTVTFDQELQTPAIDGKDWIELLKRHATIAYEGLKHKCETDPTMQEYALSRVKRPTEPPRPLTDPERRDLQAKEARKSFSLLQFTRNDDGNQESDPDDDTGYGHGI